MLGEEEKKKKETGNVFFEADTKPPSDMKD